MQKYGGISRYHVEIAKHLNADKEAQVLFPSFLTDNQHWLDSGLASRLNRCARPLFSKHYRGKWRFLRFVRRFNHRQALNALQTGQYEIFHPTYYDPYFLQFIGNRPLVLTIHDLIHELYPHYFPKDDPVAEWTGTLVPKASIIIAISDNTKEDLMRIYKVKESKIRVIYHGSPENLDEQPDVPELPEKYLLFVGNRDLYKNFNGLLRAVVPLFKECEDTHLVCIGGGKFNQQETALLAEYGVVERVHQCSVTDREARQYYKHAKCLVYPSAYEGFGLPILEAFAFSCPVAMSDTRIHREIAGDAGVYFKLEDERNILETLEELLTDQELRNRLNALGRERSKLFSWKKCAELHKEVYESVL